MAVLSERAGENISQSCADRGMFSLSVRPALPEGEFSVGGFAIQEQKIKVKPGAVDNI